MFLCVAIYLFTGASKWDIRHKVWDYIEGKNLANFPRPVHNRIPNFKVSLRVIGFIIAHLYNVTLKTGNIVGINRTRKQEAIAGESFNTVNAGLQIACFLI